MQGQIRDLSLGKVKAADESNQRATPLALKPPSYYDQSFDPENSYFSEDGSDAEQDEIIQWQKETMQFRFTKGDFIDPVERMLMESGFETRETKKAEKLKLDTIGLKVNRKFYNPKEILKKMKKAGVRGNQQEVEIAQMELN